MLVKKFMETIKRWGLRKVEGMLSFSSDGWMLVASRETTNYPGVEFFPSLL
jgi:hypothetical protein